MRRASAPLLVVLAALLLVIGQRVPPGEAQPATSVSGEAFGASVDVPGVVIAKVPQVTLPPEGGSASATVLGVSQPGTLESGTLVVETMGTTAPSSASAESTSSVQQVSILGGLVTADVLTAHTSCTCDGTSASCSSAGTEFLNLVVDGTPIAVTPGPNTSIAVPGVGTVILNEQFEGGDGVDSASLTVNLVHVILEGPLGGDVIVASAHSDVNCAGGPVPTPSPTAQPGVCPPQPTATPGAGNAPIVSGEATGASVDVPDVASIAVAHVVLPPEGGSASATVLGVSQPGTLESGTLSSTTSGTTGPTSASSQSTSAVQDANVLAGLVTADVVEAVATSSCDGTSASSSSAGSTFTNLVVNGVVLGNVTPAPNTTIAIPGVATVILNEQTTSGDGADTSAITVTMIHVILEGPGGGDIIVASAHSDVDCDPASPAPPPSTTVSGEAFGASADVSGPVTALIDPTPHVVLPPAGGAVQATVLGLATPGVLSTGTMTAMTSGTTGASSATSQSTSSVEQASLLDGLVTADLITAQTSCGCDGASASCSPTGSSFVNLVVNGTPIAATPPPNTTIPIPGVGTVFLNEQIAGGDGMDTAELTVTMIRVELAPTLNGGPTGEIIVGSASSDVDCTQGPVPTPSPTSTAQPTATCTPGPTATAPTPTLTLPILTPTLTIPGPTPLATPLPPLNHFLCYELHHGPVAGFNVSLEDQFGPSTIEVKKPKRLCNPADKNDEDPTAPSDPDHLVTYTVRQREPRRFTKVRDVQVENQFGTIVVDVVKPFLLMVPSGKSASGNPDAPETPAVGHFKCYRIRGARTRVPAVKLDDQFGTLTLDVKKPVSLCVPADKNEEGPIGDPEAHLMCYRVRITSGTPRFEAQGDYFINNQFGPDVVALRRPIELCLPSSKLVP